MAEFRLIEIEEIKGKFKFYKLEMNGKCQFDEFFEEVKANANLRTELEAIQTTLEGHACLQRLPPSRFKELKGSGDIKDYEVKTQSLRVYFFKDVQGKVIVCGGYKKNQELDIARMRRIKTQYVKSKKG